MTGGDRLEGQRRAPLASFRRGFFELFKRLTFPKDGIERVVFFVCQPANENHYSTRFSLWELPLLWSEESTL
jgi:hypothetical protein